MFLLIVIPKGRSQDGGSEERRRAGEEFSPNSALCVRTRLDSGLLLGLLQTFRGRLDLQEEVQNQEEDQDLLHSVC